MGITVHNLTKSYAATTVIDAISFDVADGEFVTLLGPSGCGKTTTLRCIAGLETPNGGRIVINGRTMSDAGAFVAPHLRNLGMVFQSYAIWPHLTVAQNVAFPLTVKGERDAAAAVRWALDIVGMAHLATRRPSELSGGQQQRVALARAIAGRPKLLLFDEPLSNLDARLRDRTRLEISRIQRELKVPALYVTHDQTEALSMSDRVIVLDAGQIVQQGSPRELYQRPGNRFVADFLGGANFLDVFPDGNIWRLADGTPIEVAPGAGQSVLIRPEAIQLEAATGLGSEPGRNRLPGRIVAGMYLGPHVEYRIDVAGTEIRAFSRQSFMAGSPVTLSFSAQDCLLIDDSAMRTRHAA